MPKLVDSSEIMTSRRYVHLPTEILMQIAKFIFGDDWIDGYVDFPHPQVTLQRFCAVSRQWYSAGIEFLYCRPQLSKGNSFLLFTNTVCPPLRSRGRKVNLGSLVRFLNLEALVHHSSNSLTARLLGRVKKNLTAFVAPRISFSINSLAPLAKCKELAHLSLRLVAEPIPFSAIKRTINSLDKLRYLELPSSMFITDDGSSEDWPPNLECMKVGGHFDAEEMYYFRWPRNLIELKLCGCEDLDTPVLEHIVMNEHIRTTLTKLSIHRLNGGMFKDGPTQILTELDKLHSLQIPVDLLYHLLILPAFDAGDSPSSIRELELTAPYDENFPLVMEPEHICKALKFNLSRVCYLGISPGCLRVIPEASHAKIDRFVWKNIDKCPEEELDSLCDFGLVVMDQEPVC